MNDNSSNITQKRQFTVSMLPLESVQDSSVNERDPKLLLNLHRRIPLLPLLKKNVTEEQLMTWNPSPLTESLSISAKKLKDLIKTVDKTFTEIIKQQPVDVPYELINELLHIGLFEHNGSLRDEIYLQLMRRINGVCEESESKCMWKLMICITAAFPPSKGMCTYISRWFNSIEKKESESDPQFIRSIIKKCRKNLFVFRISGPRGYSTSIEDVKFWYDEAFEKLPLFGSDLDEIYADENLIADYGSYKVPKIVLKLLDMIRNLNGFKKEGIFRVSGDLQQVFQLKNLLSKECDNVNIQSFRDASVPCSTLKLWMRVLRNPLIPDNLYSQILVARNNPKKLATLLEESLPKPNYSVMLCICNFLIELAEPEHQKLTKMSLDNFSMIFAPCFMRCPLTASALEVLRRSGEERQVLKEIFNHFISIKKA